MKEKLPIFLMAGTDKDKRRQVLEEKDPEHQYNSRAQLPFLGKRIVDYIVDELVQSSYVGTIYVIGQTKETMPFNHDHPIEYVSINSASDFPDKLLAGLERLQKDKEEVQQIIVCTSDVPGIKKENINEFLSFVEKREGHDFIMSVVPVELEIQEFGESNRVVPKLKDKKIFPGEMYMLSPKAIRVAEDFIRDVSGTRETRSIWRLLSYLIKKPRTIPIILKYAIGQAKLKDAVRLIEIAFGCKADVYIVNDLGYGMDIDLPGDYEKLETFVRKTKPESIPEEYL